jgi:hypothetical protein
MRRDSVADGFRPEDRARSATLGPAERIARTLALGRRDLRFYAAASGLSMAAARRAVERRRQARRRPSGVVDALLT